MPPATRRVEPTRIIPDRRAASGAGAKAAELQPCPGGLHADHYAKLRASGLSLETIAAAEAHSEHDTVKLRRMLCGSLAVAPALVLPGFGRDGKRNGYDVARMFPPHRYPDGREAKYLAPTGLGSRAYFPPLPCVKEAMGADGATLVITEGILKALAASQAGVPCVGLMGVWNWQERRADQSGPRKLIADLTDIDWCDRSVLIVFDTDRVRKRGVNQAAAELARVLTDHGADVHVLRLPPGPPGPNRRPTKQAIDDFIVRLARRAGSQASGEAAFREWVRGQLAEPPSRELTEYRAAMRRAREQECRAIGRAALARLDAATIGSHETTVTRDTLFDHGPTGVGKSHADWAALKTQEERAMEPWKNLADYMQRQLSHPRSVTLVPTHAHCAEVVEAAAGQEVEAVAYPRLDGDTCLRYDEAAAVMGRGLAFQKVLCPECPHRDGCLYREQWKAANAAHHAVATQARGVCTLPDLSRKRDLIVLHETPLDVIRPTVVTGGGGLLVVEMVARQAALDAAGAKDRGFYRHLARVARELHGWLEGSNGPDEVPLPEPARHQPEDVHRDLNEAVVTSELAPPAEAMQLALAAALGNLSLVAVAVDERPCPAKDGEEGPSVKIVRRLVGVTRTDLPPGCWLSDATADRAELEGALGRPLRDITPAGRLFRHHPALQVIPARDVTKAREPAAVLPLLRGVLHDLPYRRVGLLTHKRLAASLPNLLEEPYRGRLAMVEYFGGGYSRGSNAWITACDALVILGTPRVGADAVQLHLFRLGKVRAARRSREEIAWGPDDWSGLTESGRRVTVRTPHYADHDWHAAYCSLVRSELVQAVGRGRGILPEGVPVLVVSTENLAPPDREDGRNGLPLADWKFAPLTHAQARVLACLASPRPTTTRAVARGAEVSRPRAYELLAELVRAGRVRKVGERGGWQALAVDPFGA
jgi:hypothetical protein